MLAALCKATGRVLQADLTKILGVVHVPTVSIKDITLRWKLSETALCPLEVKHCLMNPFAVFQEGVLTDSCFVFSTNNMLP